mgnify:CR=1 FL=1
MFQTVAGDRFAITNDFEVGDMSFQSQFGVRVAAIVCKGSKADTIEQPLVAF